MNSHRSLFRPLSRLSWRELMLAAACYGLGGCVSLAVGTATTVVKVGTGVVGIGVSVGKTVVKTGATAIDLAVPD